MNQNNLIEQIKLYLDSQPDYDWNLPDKYDIDIGVCSGLVALWLYRMRTGKKQLINQELEHALIWQPNNAPDQNKKDKEMDHLINAILLLQRDSAWRRGVMQNNLAASFNLLLDKNDSQVSEPEFSATFVFDKHSLEALLNKTIHDNKMLRIASNDHVIAVIKIAGKYYFYDPNNMPIECNNISEITEEIIKLLGNTALRLDVYDLVGEKNKKTYPTDYAAEMLRNADLKSKAKHNKELLNLAVTYADYAMLDNLFANNLIDKNDAGDEIIQTISADNPDMLRYLFAYGVKVDVIQEKKLTFLGEAINANSVEMVCILLDAGVDPNQEVMPGYNPLAVAIASKNYAMASVLIAAGAKPTQQDVKNIKKSNIIKNAVEINANLLDVVSNDELETASLQQLINYMLHLHFKKNLDLPFEPNELAAVKIISNRYKTLHAKDSSNIVHLDQEAKLHELLESLHARGFRFDGEFAELSEVFDGISKSVLSKPFAEHSLTEIQELPIILATIDEFLNSHKLGFLSAAWSTRAKREIVTKAQTTRALLLQYLNNYNITDINEYINEHKLGSKIGLYFGKRDSNNPDKSIDAYEKLKNTINSLSYG